MISRWVTKSKRFVLSRVCFYIMSRSITSLAQFKLMVAFMEEHGDLNKPCDGPRGRLSVAEQWEQLTVALNSCGTGNIKTEEKWKKVWSDFKNKIKKKLAKIHQAATETGGSPAVQASLSDLERRVLTIMNSRSVVWLEVPKFEVDKLEPLSPSASDSPQTSPTAPACSPSPHSDTPAATTAAATTISSWRNVPSTSRAPSPPPGRCVPARRTPSPESEPEDTERVLPPPPSIRHMPTPAPQATLEQHNYQHNPPLVASRLTSRRHLRRITPYITPGPSRRRLRQTTAPDREWREYIRNRDEEDRRFREEQRRFREESEQRRESTEQRWQELFGRFLDVLERFIPPPSVRPS